MQTESNLPRSLLEKPGTRLHGLPPAAELKTMENRSYKPQEPLIRGAQLALRTATQAAVTAKGRKLRKRAESGTDLPQITAPQARKHCSNTQTFVGSGSSARGSIVLWRKHQCLAFSLRGLRTTHGA